MAQFEVTSRSFRGSDGWVDTLVIQDATHVRFNRKPKAIAECLSTLPADVLQTVLAHLVSESGQEPKGRKDIPEQQQNGTRSDQLAEIKSKAKAKPKASKPKTVPAPDVADSLAAITSILMKQSERIEQLETAK